MEPAPGEVTPLLGELRRGSPDAGAKLPSLVCEHHHHLAAHYMRQEHQDHTPRATALLNEAYLRLVFQEKMEWQDRARFFGIAARLMREILVDHARARQAGGERWSRGEAACRGSA